MTRKNIFDLLEEKYDIKYEMEKITQLFFSPLFTNLDPYSYNQTSCTIENIVDNRLLYVWKQRKNCLSCNEIKIKLDLKFDFSELDNVILILEYFENLIYLVDRYVSINNYNYNYKIIQEYIMLKENINNLLDYINHEIFWIAQEEKVLIVPKNPAATSVAEISNDETAMAILMYNHHTLKGDLEAKRKILHSIAKEYEPLLSKPIDGFKDYFVKATNMLNNLDIRHNNKKGKHKNNLVVNLKNDELEKWYDELYQLLLFCVLIKDNIERKNNIEEFLKNLKQGA